MAREKYDPFGNPIGEDTHGGFGAAAPAPATPPPAGAATSTGLPPAAAPPPVFAAPPATTTAPRTLGAPPPVIPVFGAPPAAPPRRRRRGSLLGLVGLVLRLAIPLAIVGGIVVAINGAVDSTVKHAAPSIVRPLINGTAGDAPTPARPAAPAPPPHGLSHRSLLRAADLRSALRRGAAAGRGRLKQLRLAPDRLDLQFGRRDGGLDLVQVRWDTTAPSVVRSPSGNSSATAPIAVGGIDVHAPARLVRRAARQLHRKAGAIDYLVLLEVAGQTRWAAYFKGGKGAFMADAHGRITQRMY